ncbi:hypothetical protein BH18ACT16_BH18ACT16_00350 [soil metagenome]
MHAHTQIEAMGGVALGSRVEMDLPATETGGLVEHPAQQCGGVALAARLGKRDEVGDLEEAAPS